MFAVGFPFLGVAQDLSLQNCWEVARAHYPLLEGKKALAEATDLNIRNVRTEWLPRIDLSGQATWQNDVPHVSGIISGFTIPSAPKDQYKVWLDVSQTIYDGGRVAARQDLEQSRGDVELQNVEVQLQEVERRVTELFFTVLMFNEQEGQLQFMEKDLESRIREATSGVENGVVPISALKSLSVERLRLAQRLIVLQEGRKAMLDNLGLYLGRQKVEPTELIAPGADLFIEAQPRAEYILFDLRKLQLERGVTLTKRNRMPALSAFAQGGYGNPTYNMLNDAFDVLYMVGLRLKWTPWDWQQSKRNRAVFARQNEWVDFQRQTFEVNQARAVRQMEGEADQYQKLMQKDDEILLLQSEITNDSRQRLKNGTITAADYLAELNAEARARLDKAIHHLQYLKSEALKYHTAGE